MERDEIMKTLNKITSILLSGILFGMFAAPMQINAEETVELLPLEANEHSTLETRATNGTDVYKRQGHQRVKQADYFSDESSTG